MESPLATTIGARLSAYLSTAEDFHKYRSKINKQLLRLRHELGLITRDTKNYKAKEKISSISSGDYDNNSRYGLLLLLTAERDLVYSLEIKSKLEISSESASSYKNLMISRLKKSISSTKKLLSITVNESDESILIDLYIYSALNEGSLAINKKKWEAALNAFSIAKCALEYLYSQKSEEDMDNQFNKSVISELIETLVDPSLSLAVSQLDRPDLNLSTSDLKSVSRKCCHFDTIPYLQKLVELIKKKDSSFVSEIASTVKLIDSITWRSHEAKLYNDEIAFKVMNLIKPEVNAYDKAELFDQVISEWSKTLELHQNDLNKNQDEDDQDKIQDRAILSTFINYNLLFTRIRRDTIVIDDLSSTVHSASKVKKLTVNKDITRMLNSIVSIIEEIKELPGVYNDDELMESLDTMIQFTHFRRLVRLSDSFLLKEKYLESLKILNTIKEKIDVNGLNYLVEDFPYKVSSNNDLSQFKSQVDEIFFKTQILAQFSFELEKNPNNFVAENMNQFPSSSAILNVGEKPVLKPILSKPVLFDVAFNYINYTSNSSKAGSVEPAASTTSTADEESKKKSGFFGIFGRS